MSIEEQLSNAVQACNNLAAAVNGKVSEIDEKVVAAVKAIPQLSRSYYVSNDGNDANDGTSASPLRTIPEAVNRTPKNGSVTVYLNKGQEFFVTGDTYGMPDITDKTITIRAYGNGNNPLLKMRAQNTSSGSIAAGFLVYDSAKLTVIEVDVDTGDFPIDATQTYASYGGLVSRAGTQGEIGFCSMSFSYCKIILRDHQLSSHYMRVDYSMRTVEIDHQGSRKSLNSGGNTFNITVSGVTLTDPTKTWGDVFSGASAENSLTNISSFS